MINIDRVIAGRLGVTMQALNDTLYDAFGQRQVSTIYGQSNQYRVVLEVDPRYQKDIAALSSIYVPGNAISNSTGGNATTGLASASSGGATSSAISAVPAVGQGRGAQVPFSRFRHHRACHRAALGQPRPAISGGHDQLRCRAWRVARRRRAGNRRCQRADRHAVFDRRQLHRRRGRVHCVAQKPAAADPGRARHDLHHPGRSLRKLHPSLHDPDHAALRGHRRAARRFSCSGWSSLSSR